jgi:hypothetical protein
MQPLARRQLAIRHAATVSLRAWHAGEVAAHAILQRTLQRVACAIGAQLDAAETVIARVRAVREAQLQEEISAIEGHRQRGRLSDAQALALQSSVRMLREMEQDVQEQARCGRFAQTYW